MRAYREDMPGRQGRGGVYAMLAGAAILVLVTLLYFGLRDEPTIGAPAMDPTTTELAGAQAAQGLQEIPVATDFVERQLPSPVIAVSAGEAPVVERQDGETLVITGELLEELEADAAEAVSE